MRRRPKTGPVPHPVTVEPSEVVSPEEEPAGLGQPTPRMASRPKQPDRRAVTIGKSVRIKGELSGNEDITVDGSVEGKIVLKGHNLSIGPNGRIKGEVSAKSVIVVGRVVGNISAEDRVEVTEDGTVHGDIRAPRVVLADGAEFTGTIDMQCQPAGIQAPASGEPSQDQEVEDAALEKKQNDETMKNPTSDRRDDEKPEKMGRGSFQKPSREDMPGQKPSLGESSPGKPAREHSPGVEVTREDAPSQKPSLGESSPGKPAREHSPGVEVTREDMPGQKPSLGDSSPGKPAREHSPGVEVTREDMPGQKPSLRDSSPGNPAVEQPTGAKPSGKNRPESIGPAKA